MAFHLTLGYYVTSYGTLLDRWMNERTETLAARVPSMMRDEKPSTSSRVHTFTAFQKAEMIPRDSGVGMCHTERAVLRPFQEIFPGCGVGVIRQSRIDRLPERRCATLAS